MSALIIPGANAKGATSASNAACDGAERFGDATTGRAATSAPAPARTDAVCMPSGIAAGAVASASEADKWATAERVCTSRGGTTVDATELPVRGERATAAGSVEAELGSDASAPGVKKTGCGAASPRGRLPGTTRFSAASVLVFGAPAKRASQVSAQAICANGARPGSADCAAEAGITPAANSTAATSAGDEARPIGKARPLDMLATTAPTAAGSSPNAAANDESGDADGAADAVCGGVACATGRRAFKESTAPSLAVICAVVRGIASSTG